MRFLGKEYYVCYVLGKRFNIYVRIQKINKTICVQSRVHTLCAGAPSNAHYVTINLRIGRALVGSYARLQNCEKRLLASSCPSVRPYVRKEQLGSDWTDFH